MHGAEDCEDWHRSPGQPFLASWVWKSTGSTFLRWRSKPSRSALPAFNIPGSTNEQDLALVPGDDAELGERSLILRSAIFDHTVLIRRCWTCSF